MNPPNPDFFSPGCLTPMKQTQEKAWGLLHQIGDFFGVRYTAGMEYPIELELSPNAGQNLLGSASNEEFTSELLTRDDILYAVERIASGEITHKVISDSQQDQRTQEQPEESICQLPCGPGFFWWRVSANDDWRMVQIVDFAAGIPTAQPHLAAYDVEKHDWSGRTLRIWELHEPIGEWIKCHKPNETAPVQQK